MGVNSTGTLLDFVSYKQLEWYGRVRRNKIAQTDFGMNSARKRKEGKTKENLDERCRKWNEGRDLKTGLGGKRKVEKEDKNLNILDTGRCRWSRAVASWSKASCLVLALRNARRFESSCGKKFSHELSASVWDQCPPSMPTQHRDAAITAGRIIVLRYLHSGWMIVHPSVVKVSYNGWEDHRANTRYLHSDWMIVHLCFGMWA
ncbi:hypothetical protein ANN_21143 [Periplaneta americana]|uniref:Uncharacterized protein n=1 Tax=Periplaneta americana TaxID=6978 RepID=A0ABQ8SEI9_PERAM|nr:hypothetical protein ANN_21143 [Periplaneta americana]